MKRALPLAVLSALSLPIHAGDFSLTINGISKHSQATFVEHTHTHTDYHCTAQNVNSGCDKVVTVTETRKAYNEKNEGFGIAYVTDGGYRLTAGQYKDSFYTQARYYLVGAEHSFFFPSITPGARLTVGAAAGLIYSKSYSQRYSKAEVVPGAVGVVLPYISLGTKYMRINFSYTPGDGTKESAEAVAAQLEIPIL